MNLTAKQISRIIEHLGITQAEVRTVTPMPHEHAVLIREWNHRKHLVPWGVAS